MSRQSILDTGRNCWRIENATRAAWLIDSDAYFRAFRSSVAQARRSVIILAWDINSRLRLVRDERPSDGLPARLGEFLNAVLSRKPDLNIYLLPWDFHLVYALEREWLPYVRFGLTDRLHLRLDGCHPLGGSQHQKVVVVDDRVAFVGGLDLTTHRWDTTEHRVEDPRRKDPSGRPFPPFHDVQMVVEGPAASSLAELARDRWKAATGFEPGAAGAGPEPEASPWPENVEPDLKDARVAIARTLPAYGDREEVREVESLYLDAIENARRFLYFENQYFSCRRLAQALLSRLEAEDGPEIVMVLPRETDGWLEKHTMDLLRTGLLERMRQADRNGRLRIYYPASAAGGREQPIFVHDKVMIADDRIARIGSANLSNRSMGLDSECDLAVEAADPSQEKAIGRFRVRLLAEHLGLDPDTAEVDLEKAGSMIRAIEDHRGGERSLHPLPVEFDSELDRQIAEVTWLDPERSMDPDYLIRREIPEETRLTARQRVTILTVIVGSILVIAGLWRWSPLGDLAERESLLATFDRIEANPWAPLGAAGLVTVLGSAGVPINLLLVVSAITFGPWLGFAYCLAGAQFSALLTFAAGQFTGKKIIRKLAGRKLDSLSRRLARRGLMAVILVRVIPVAPFAVVNLVAGASHISWRHFTLGTFLGMAPGMLIVAVLTDRVNAAFRAPSMESLAFLATVAAVAVGAVVLVRKWLRGRSGSA